MRDVADEPTVRPRSGRGAPVVIKSRSACVGCSWSAVAGIDDGRIEMPPSKCGAPRRTVADHQDIGRPIARYSCRVDERFAFAQARPARAKIDRSPEPAGRQAGNWSASASRSKKKIGDDRPLKIRRARSAALADADKFLGTIEEGGDLTGGKVFETQQMGSENPSRGGLALGRLSTVDFMRLFYGSPGGVKRSRPGLVILRSSIASMLAAPPRFISPPCGTWRPASMRRRTDRFLHGRHATRP